MAETTVAAGSGPAEDQEDLKGADERISALLALPPEERGSLVIRDRVATTVARQATVTTPGVVTSRSGLATVRRSGYPRVSLQLASGHVRAAIGVAVGWPVPVARVAADVRDRVAAVLGESLGLTVDGVDVSVDEVVPAEPTPARRVL